MDNQTLPSYVVAANAQRDLYYTHQNHKDAQELVVASEFEDVVTSQNNQLEHFLAAHKIKHDATLEQLVTMADVQVSLLGATFHFSRKFFTTSHDSGEEVQNPIPLIQNVFDALVTSEDGHAVKVLDALADISSKASYNQRKVEAVVRVILPDLIHGYAASLRGLELKNNVGSKQYTAEESQLDKRQMTLLDKAVAYAKHVIKTNQEPSLGNFNSYSGSNEQAKTREHITLEYLAELSARHGTNYAAAIAELTAAAGGLVVVNNHRRIDADEIRLNIGSGGPANPKPNPLVYKKNGDDGVYRLLIAICNHIISDQSVPRELRLTTATTRTGISYYQTRG